MAKVDIRKKLQQIDTNRIELIWLKIQQEIDSVIENLNLINFIDNNQLPNNEAIIYGSFVNYQIALSNLNKIQNDSIRTAYLLKYNESDLELYYNYFYPMNETLAGISDLRSFFIINRTSDSLYYELTGKLGFLLIKDKMKVYQIENNKIVKNNIILSESEIAMFLIQFTSDESVFYIDKNYHLWTETIAAQRFFHNRIFLQMFKPFQATTSLSSL